MPLLGSDLKIFTTYACLRRALNIYELMSTRPKWAIDDRGHRRIVADSGLPGRFPFYTMFPGKVGNVFHSNACGPKTKSCATLCVCVFQCEGYGVGSGIKRLSCRRCRRAKGS